MERKSNTAGHRGNNTDKHRSPTYNSWRGMRYRCLNENQASYAHYGALGVKICERWDSFLNFLEDMGERPEGKSLDRINPFGDYEPSNCRWATSTEQAQNKRKNYVAA